MINIKHSLHVSLWASFLRSQYSYGEREATIASFSWGGGRGRGYCWSHRAAEYTLRWRRCVVVWVWHGGYWPHQRTEGLHEGVLRGIKEALVFGRACRFHLHLPILPRCRHSALRWPCQHHRPCRRLSGKLRHRWILLRHHGTFQTYTRVMKKKTIAEPSFFGNIGPHDYCNLKLEKHIWWQ